MFSVMCFFRSLPFRSLSFSSFNHVIFLLICKGSEILSDPTFRFRWEMTHTQTILTRLSIYFFRNKNKYLVIILNFLINFIKLKSIPRICSEGSF